MKKLLGILLIAFVIIGAAVSLKGFAEYSSADIDSKLQQFKQIQKQLKAYLPYYKNLATCTPYTSTDYKIYGKKNGLCHVYLKDNSGNPYDCNIPTAVIQVDSNFGQKVIGKLANLDLESTFSEENISNGDMSVLTQFMNDMTQMTNDTKTLAEIEKSMIQYHCKMK